MQNKILRTAQGDFEREFPMPSSEPEKIEQNGTEGTDIGGILRIYNTEGETLSGRIYSSNPYVTVAGSEFEAADTSISYNAHTSGFYHGERIEGYFTIVTDGYEVRIPYRFIIDERPLVVAGHQITDLTAFADIASSDPQEALQVFASDGFRTFIVRHFPDVYLSYKAVTSSMGFTRLALESFLTENNLKDSIHIHIFPDNLSFYSISDDVRESFRITRNTEGYVSLRFSTDDNSFIELGRTEATDADFFGGTLEIPFFIRKDRLHEGINQTRLYITGNGLSVEKIVTASTYGRGEVVHEKHREREKVIVKALNSYLDFRLRKTDTQEFLNGATEACEYFLNENPSDYFALCYRTMAQIVAGQRKQALTTISMLKEMIEDKDSFEWAFLLYLCTLLDPADEYIDAITSEIEQIQQVHPDDARIFWFLSFLRKKYINAPLERLRDLRQWIIRGVSSPVFYAEACDMLNSYPYMIGQFDSFSLSVLRFGIRRDAIGKQVIPSVCECLSDLKTYSDAVFDFVGRLYDRFMDTDLLEAVVAYLLRTRCIGTEYLVWYKRGIEAGLNLTGLFESYIYSVDEDDAEMLPRMLVMYFAYDNTLPDDRKEFLYANVVMYQQKRPSVYETYLRQIERFAIEKLRNRMIDDNLAVIYSDLYKRGFFDRDLLSDLYSMRNAVKIICMPEESGELYIFTRRKKDPLRTMLTKHYVVCDLSDEEFVPILVSPDGVFYSKDDFHYEKMLPEVAADHNVTDDIPFEDQLAAVQGDDYDPVYRDYFFSKATEKDLRSLYATLPSDVVSADSMTGMEPEQASFIISSLIESGRCDEAYDVIHEVNAFNVPDNLLLRLSTVECEKNEEDPFLISLCSYLLEKLLSNADTLSYLSTWYYGPTENMISLFRYANARECDVRDLSERIIIQTIYEERDDSPVRKIYDIYLRLSPDSDVAAAYQSYLSDRYIRDVSDDISSGFFEESEEYISRGENVNASVKNALLKYYSTSGTLSDDRMRVAERLLHDNMMSNVYFAFYKKLDLRLIVRSGIYERTIIEYRSDPGRTYSISLDAVDGRISEDMNEVYDGIYIFSILLFRGEKIQYQITDSAGEVVSDGTVTNHDYLLEVKDSRFGRLGNIYEETKDRKDTARKDINDYIRLDVSLKDLFSMV